MSWLSRIGFSGPQAPATQAPAVAQPSKGSNPHSSPLGLQTKASVHAGPPRTATLSPASLKAAVAQPAVKQAGVPAGQSNAAPAPLDPGQCREALGFDPHKLRKTEVLAKSDSLEGIAMLKIEILMMREDVDAAQKNAMRGSLMRGDKAAAQRASQAGSELKAELDQAFNDLKGKEALLVAAQGAGAQGPVLTRGGEPLSDVARAEMEKAPPLEATIGKLRPHRNKSTWTALEKQDPVGARCLSQMIENALDKHVRNPPANADPRLADIYRMYLRNNLKMLETTLQPQPHGGMHPFAEKMLAMATSKLGTDDRAILGNLANQHLAEAFGLKASQDLHLPQDTGYCMRAATKWAACVVTDSPFKLEGMSVGKIHDKFGMQAEAIKGAKTLEEVNEARRQLMAGWVGKFTTGPRGDKTVHRNEVTVGRCKTQSPTEYLKSRDLKKGEALMVAFTTFDKSGQASGSHMMSIRGGAQPQLFDSGLETVFNIHSTDIGKTVEQYVDKFHANGQDVQWRLFPVKAIAARSESKPAMVETSASQPSVVRDTDGLFEMARSRMEQASSPMATTAPLVGVELDRQAWAGLEQRDPVGMKCMAAMLENVVDKFWDMDRKERRELQGHLKETLRTMDAELTAGGPTPFTDRMLELAREHVGTHDLALCEPWAKKYADAGIPVAVSS